MAGPTIGRSPFLKKSLVTYKSGREPIMSGPGGQGLDTISRATFLLGPRAHLHGEHCHFSGLVALAGLDHSQNLALYVDLARSCDSYCTSSTNLSKIIFSK